MKKIIALALVVLVMSGMIAGCTKKPNKPKKLSLRLYFVEETAGEKSIGLKSTRDIAADITAKSLIGHIYANDPWGDARMWYAEAEVIENGEIVENPTIEWSTDIDGVTLIPREGRAHIAKIITSQDLQRGRGSVFAEYKGEVAAMPIIAYGLFNIENSTGWDFQNEKAVTHEESDLYFTFHSQSYYILHAPNGIKEVGTIARMEKAFFEKIENPADEGFTNEIQLEMDKIYEVIGKNDVHYKLAILGAGWSVYQDGTEKNIFDGTWDTFTSTEPTEL